MLVSCWVLLGLEKCIKIPEGAFNEVVGWHLSEPGGRCGLTTLLVPRAGPAPPLAPGSPHLQKDLPELGADFQQGVQVAAVREDAVG